jgi:hypothetical protein
LPQEVKGGEEEDPDDVHEVPVEADDFDGGVVGAAVFGAAVQKIEDGEGGDSDGDVEGVEGGGDEVGAHEEGEMLRARCAGGFVDGGEVPVGEEVLVVFDGVFAELDAEEEDAQRDGEEEPAADVPGP